MSNSLCKNQIPISAYQDPAFFISMLMNEPGYERLLYSSYIGLSWNPNDENKLNIDMNRGDMYNYYEAETIGIKSTWNLLSAENPYAFFAKLISEKIWSGYYVTGMFDEYYISAKVRYNKEHYKGQFCLVGVNELDKTFYIELGYDMFNSDYPSYSDVVYDGIPVEEGIIAAVCDLILNPGT